MLTALHGTARVLRLTLCAMHRAENFTLAHKRGTPCPEHPNYAPILGESAMKALRPTTNFSSLLANQLRQLRLA